MNTISAIIDLQGQARSLAAKVLDTAKRGDVVGTADFDEASVIAMRTFDLPEFPALREALDEDAMVALGHLRSARSAELPGQGATTISRAHALLGAVALDGYASRAARFLDEMSGPA